MQKKNPPFKTVFFKHILVAIYFILFYFLQSISAFAQQESDTGETNQKKHLENLKTLLPQSDKWEEWLDKTGELPPDFNSMESMPFIPDPFLMKDGSIITSEDEWPERRIEILNLFKHYLIGTYPDPPENIRVRNENIKEDHGIKIHEIVLEFGPDHEAYLSFELMIPEGEGPFPVFITQNNHRRWAAVAVSRGYVGVVYAGSDSKDDTEAWKSIYPEYDWTRLTRRGWAAGRIIDYLESFDYIDHDKITLTGHSRNGKTSLIGGAIDQRIDAVVASSSGAASALSFRSFSESEFGESVESISRRYPSWVHPRLRFFIGRENKLPIDAPNLISTIAPRPFLFTHALHDQYESSVWDLENSYRSVKSVYELLDASDKIGLLYRGGTHETRAEDIEQYVDWLDYQFGRSSYTPANDPIYPTINDWRDNATNIPTPDEYPARNLYDLFKLSNGAAVSSVSGWEIKKVDILERIRVGLGKSPLEVKSYPGSYGEEPDYKAEKLDRASLPDSISKYSLNFGNYINGDLYFPEGQHAENSLPVVIWLHPISPARGYVEAYHRGTEVYLSLVQAGYAVLAFDMIGHGSRLEETFRFYERYPDWTLLGKMVHDVSQALNALELDSLTELDTFGDIRFINQNQIYLMGYGMGGKVALHAAALDERVTGVVSVAGFTPMRLNTEDKGTGGLARWSTHYPLQPWLSEFIGREAHVPYDYHEVLAAIAPRKVTIIEPEINRLASTKDVKLAVEEAAKIFKLLDGKEQVRLNIPFDYNQLGPEMKNEVIEELKIFQKK